MTCVTAVPRLLITLVLATALAGAPALINGAVTPAAAEGSSEVYRVPDSGRFKLAGSGFGHGIGMSQFGAQGMGLLGKSYRQVLKFYYPGTDFDRTAKTRKISVLLSGIVRHDFGKTVVALRPRHNLRFLHNGKAHALPTRVDGHRVGVYRVLRTSNGMQVRAYGGGASRVVVSGVTGGVRFLTNAKPATSRVTVVSTSGNNRTYRGFLDVRRSTAGLLPISTLLLEHYLRSVVAAEVPSSWTNAALRAQAVAARSYALLAQLDARSEGRRYDICDNSNCQAYGPVSFESKAESLAVKATEGVYLSSKGKPAFTQFSSANGGYSVAGSRGYLVAKRDPYDGIVTGAANWGHSWDVTVSARTISHAWPTIGKLRAIKVLSRDGNGRWNGRVRSLALVGSRGTVNISGDSFRWGLGLKSTWWTVKNA